MQAVYVVHVLFVNFPSGSPTIGQAAPAARIGASRRIQPGPPPLPSS
jgi:hypothetical protein